MKVTRLDTERSGVSCVTYQNDTIQTISFPKARDVFSSEDCAGNEVSPDDTILSISFKDGGAATFVAHNWYISDL